VRDDACARIEGNRISARAFLRNKSADGQSNSGDADQRAGNPSERATYEAGRDEPFERKRPEDRQDEEKRRRDRNARTIFMCWQFGSHVFKLRFAFAMSMRPPEQDKRAFVSENALQLDDGKPNSFHGISAGSLE
jgi:hypothetical protein